jgi:hypothetical protein
VAKTAETKCQGYEHDPEYEGVRSNPERYGQGAGAGKDENEEPKK